MGLIGWSPVVPHNWGMRPTFVRFPSGNSRCPVTGLTRGHLHDLCVPCGRNGFRPPVKSHLVGSARRGARFIDVASLLAYLDKV